MDIVKIPENEFKIYSRALLVTLTLRDLLYELSDLEKGVAPTEAGKEKVIMANAQKFIDVFGFDLRDIPPSDVYEWLMKPYEEPKHEAM